MPWYTVIVELKPEKATSVMSSVQFVELGHPGAPGIGVTGPAENVLKIRPPLVFGRAEADLLVTTLDEALSAIDR